MLGFAKRGAQRLASGTSGYLRSGQTGALCTQDAHARFQEAVLGGNVWIGANAAGTPITPSVGLNAVGVLTLFNPLNSPVNLVLWTVTLGVTTGQAANTVYSLAYALPTAASVPTGPITTLTAATSTNAMLGLGQSATVGKVGPWGQCYTVATLNATPVAFRYMFLANWISAAGIAAASFIDHVDGEVVIPPGVAINICASAATPTVASFTWEEVPIIP